ncbi:MAG: cytochrome ubiquinol oxidase subunit I [Candidatus Kryptoniota bacterium]
MHYPWWYVPGLTAPMLIALVATFHVFVSMYAVGGGIFLAAETSYAYKINNKLLLEYLRSHALFFILITVVFGAITGVGIWWTIGLTSPLATESLIHIFVFAWAMEYVFFILEIISAFIFYYYWGRLDSKTHMRIGWIYAISAWISLALITGITSFQLDIGNWTPEKGMWAAFFNPQTFPQILARTGASLMLAALYVFLHSSFKLSADIPLKNLTGTRASRWGMTGAILVTFGGSWWYLALPESGKAALTAASALNVLTLIIFASSIVVFFMLYLGPYRNPDWISPGFAIMFFLLGIAATGTGEFIRESTRKPYIIYNYVLGNNILVSEVPTLQSTGYLNGGIWTKAFIKAHYPQVIDKKGNIDNRKLVQLSDKDQEKVGEVIFQYHCNDCHSQQGFSGVSDLTRGWSEDMIKTVIIHLDAAHFFMPPWSGTEQEAAVLARYLKSLSLPHPSGMRYSSVNFINHDLSFKNEKRGYQR